MSIYTKCGPHKAWATVLGSHHVIAWERDQETMFLVPCGDGVTCTALLIILLRLRPFTIWPLVCLHNRHVADIYKFTCLHKIDINEVE